MFNIAKFYKKNKTLILYFLLIFISTRIALTAIGLLARTYPPPPFVKPGPYSYYSNYPWLNLWGIWDSGWYMEIAKNGYSNEFNNLGQGNIGFFPLYPLLIRLTSILVKDYYISGIIVSNVSLFAAAYFLYNLLKLETDNETSLRSVKFLFLHPAAFVLSSVFTESLFLALLIGSFYYAKKRRWKKVGILGFFLSLTKPVGFLFFFLILFEYLKSTKAKIKEMNPDILYLLLNPLGLYLFIIYTYFLTGDWFAYLDTKIVGWNVWYINPFAQVLKFLKMNNLFRFTIGLTAIVEMSLLTLFYKKISFIYWIFGVVIILIPLMAGDSSALSLLRQTLIIFPIYIILAKIGRNIYLDLMSTFVLLAFQLWTMAFWVNKFFIF